MNIFILAAKLSAFVRTTGSDAVVIAYYILQSDWTTLMVAAEQIPVMLDS